jgi:hypothetical protein
VMDTGKFPRRGCLSEHKRGSGGSEMTRTVMGSATQAQTFVTTVRLRLPPDDGKPAPARRMGGLGIGVGVGVGVWGGVGVGVGVGGGVGVGVGVGVGLDVGVAVGVSVGSGVSGAVGESWQAAKRSSRTLAATATKARRIGDIRSK